MLNTERASYGRASHCAARLSRYDIQLRRVKQSRPPYRLRHFMARSDIARGEARSPAEKDKGRERQKKEGEKEKSP